MLKESVQLTSSALSSCVSSQVCGNVAGLAQWTIAMRDFYFVNVIVLPLVNSQKRMEAKHTKATNELNDAEAKLEEVMSEVNTKKQELAKVQLGLGF